MTAMPRPCLLAPAVAALAIGLTLAPLAGATRTLLLELRIFSGPEEVTAHTRVTVHRAGERDRPAAQATGSAAGIQIKLPEGIYDVQAIEERDGRVINIQWMHRVVLMPYPDEQGRHLEVLNFKSGYGALQVRGAGGLAPEVRLHKPGTQGRNGLAPISGAGYALFVLPAGAYDVTVVRDGSRTTRHTGVEVPRDRTRLWFVPDEL